MAANVRKMNTKRTRYLELRASGQRQSEAAPAAGISLRQARRWDTDPAFRQQLEAEIESRLEEARAILRDAATEAARKLQSLLSCGLVSQERQAAEAILRLTGLEPGFFEKMPTGELGLVLRWTDDDAPP